MKTFTTDELKEVLDKENWPLVNRWLERGDGVAIYENHDMGSHDVGHKKFVSFGSVTAQLEVQEPPQRLPDIGGQINWRYQLIGTYKGEALS
jgi:hypothetical protein